MDNSRYEIKITDKETGEIVVPEDDIRFDFLEAGDRVVRSKSINSFLNREINMVKNFNQGQHFAKLFLKNWGYIMNRKLSDAALAFLMLTAPLTQPESNMILGTDSKPITNKELSILLDKKSSAITKVLSELQDKKAIIIEGKTHGRKIYVNPYIISYGTNKDRKLIEMFKDWNK